MRLNTFFLAFLAIQGLFIPSRIVAQQADTSRKPPPFLIVSGAADAYYRYDFARTASNALTSFTHSQNQFDPGMVQVKLEHRTSRVDLVADLAMGPRQNEYACNDRGIARAIRQFYITYSPTSWLKLTTGTWATHLCYESPDASANRNYSMSYLFSSDPFSHTGLKAEVTTGKNGFMIGISNPANYRSIPDSAKNNKNIIAQYAYSPNDNIKICFNYVGGRDTADNRSHQYDVVLTAKTSSPFSFGWNATINRSSTAIEKYQVSRSWWGAAFYVNFDPHNWLGLTLRTEYFSDTHGLCLPAPATLLANTLSANFKVDGLTVIPEFRIDHADNPIYFHANGSAATTTASFLLAAVYAF
jgi:hypothetical protein